MSIELALGGILGCVHECVTLCAEWQTGAVACGLACYVTFLFQKTKKRSWLLPIFFFKTAHTVHYGVLANTNQHQLRPSLLL